MAVNWDEGHTPLASEPEYDAAVNTNVEEYAGVEWLESHPSPLARTRGSWKRSTLR